MEDKKIKLELSRVFDAPRELVFQAWTDADQFKQWFGAAACDGAVLQSVKVDARVGGKYRLQVRRADGEFYTTVGTYRTVKPPERLVFTWAFEKDGSGEESGEVEPCEMLVTLEFRARGKQTELILTQENFASVESRDRHEQGWNRCLNELGKVVGQKNESAQTGGKFLVGTEFIITREYAAPRELVWLACTDAKHLAQWWGPRGFTAPVCEWDARPGNKIYVVMRAPDGTRYPMGGEFLEVDPPERLVTVTGPLNDDGNLKFEFRHVLTLAEQNGKTKLTMHSRLQKVTAPDAGRYIGGFEAGMTQSLERLADLVEDVPLVIERTFEAPVALVWRAITTKAGMDRWFFELTEFKPQAGFEFQFAVEHEGHRYDHRCRVTEVNPEQKIAFTWRYAGYAGDSLVTLELFAEGGDRTRLKLTHTGLETFPKTPAFARRNFLQGWTQLIGAWLKDYVEHADREIFVTRDFAAPRELVWEALTNPRHVVNWWGPRGFTTTIETMDVRPGGVWQHTLRGPDGVKYPNHSVFQEVVKPERIVYAHGGRRENGPGVNFAATWTFELLTAEKTRVTLRMVFPSAAERDFVAKEFGAIEGAQQTFERLGEHLANSQAQNADRPNSQQSQVALPAGH
jgi:uncharacterized protein YndB with AHSA1/START domain